MSQKKKIVKVLSEMDNQKHVVMTSDKYKELGDELDDDTVVKIVDEDDSQDDESVNMPKLQADVQKFMDKLNLAQFSVVIQKIDKPIEKAELIAAFAERIGVPREKLNVVLAKLRKIGKDPVVDQKIRPENTRPRMKKSDLVEHVLKNKK